MRMLGLAALLACAGCAAEAGAEPNADSDAAQTASTKQAITNGDDDDADSAIVALMSGGKTFCTGVLITPTVVLTAAHCVLPLAPEQIFFGSRPSSKKGKFIPVSDTHAHPDFNEDTLENDIALVGLATKASAAPLNVVTRELDDSFVGREIRVVGFGAPGPDQITSLRKRTGVTTIASYGDDDFRFVPSPSGTCVGDSGGPALVTSGDHEAVVGITSSGDSECKKYGRDIRVDRHVAFIRSYAKAYSLPADPAAENKGCSMSTPRAATRPSASALLLAMALAAATGWRRRVSAGRGPAPPPP